MTSISRVSLYAGTFIQYGKKFIDYLIRIYGTVGSIKWNCNLYAHIAIGTYTDSYIGDKN